jgi:hypothetical protein
MNHWQFTKDVIEIALQALTIIVLAITLWAVVRQARAAEKLTKATDQQIKTGEEQAKAAREQVEVARRQITESLRPILICDVSPPFSKADGFGSVQDVKVQNNGAGTALDVWWSYGKFGDPPAILDHYRVQSGILPPMSSATFQVRESLAVTKGIVIIYTSLSGIDSVSTLYWEGNDWVPQYIPDAGVWTRTLLGKRLGPVA